MMSLWDALRMNMMISYQELVRTFLNINDEGEEQQWQSTHLFFGFLNFRLIKPLYPFNFCQRCGPV
ncbi:hypothetical protein DCI34_21010 [Salmonella enterica subsp. enterica serovar Typhimurium]|nr:hypothetical protein [Salmonella enterica subsp. enterica serovar Typhimurium]